jgi:PBP1b-binding outer membrane lipoprotein LpoB
MSVIGDYIHLNFENYKKYGTAKVNETPQSYISSCSAQLLKNRQQIEALNDSNIDTVLEELRSRVANESNQKEAMDLAKQKVAFAQGINKLSDNIKSQILNNVSGDLKAKKMTFKNTRIKTDNNNIKIEEAKKNRRNLFDNINRFNEDTKKGKIFNVAQRLKTIINNFNSFFSNLGISTTDGSQFSDSFKISSDLNSLAALKTFVQSIQLGEANKATLNGVFGEILVNMADDEIKILVEQGLHDTLEDALEKRLKKGMERSSFSIDKDMFSPSVQQQLYEDTGLNIYQIRRSQDKVDGSIIINDQKIEASVKAYSTRGNIATPHLQDINLLYSLLSTEEQFANHWLNLHMATSDMSGKYGRITDKMDTELKKHMAYEALSTGNLLKKGASQANVFVAIDVTKGKVYVEKISKMLQSLENFVFSPNISNIKFDNDSQAESWEARISKIIQQVRLTKIMVRYKVNFATS